MYTLFIVASDIKNNITFDNLKDKSNKEFQKFLESNFFDLIYKNSKDVITVINSFFNICNDEKIILFWNFFKNNINKFGKLIKNTNNLSFCINFMEAIHLNGQSLNIIKVFNNMEILKKFRKSMQFLISSSEPHIYQFILSICVNNEIIQLWSSNLSFDIKDELFNIFWHNHSSFFTDTSEEQLQGLQVVADYLNGYSNDECLEMIKNFFKFIKDNQFYIEFWKRFNIMTSSYNNSPLYDCKDKIRYVIISFAKSEDDNLRKIFRDLMYAKRDSYFLFFLQFTKEDVDNIIQTGYYNDDIVLKNKILNMIKFR